MGTESPEPARHPSDAIALWEGHLEKLMGTAQLPLRRGHPEVVDADLADYFGSIPHSDLLKSVARRIVDRRVLHLIKV